MQPPSGSLISRGQVAARCPPAYPAVHLADSRSLVLASGGLCEAWAPERLDDMLTQQVLHASPFLAFNSS